MRYLIVLLVLVLLVGCTDDEALAGKATEEGRQASIADLEKMIRQNEDLREMFLADTGLPDEEKSEIITQLDSNLDNLKTQLARLTGEQAVTTANAAFDTANLPLYCENNVPQVYEAGELGSLDDESGIPEGLTGGGDSTVEITDTTVPTDEGSDTPSATGLGSAGSAGGTATPSSGSGSGEDAGDGDTAEETDTTGTSTTDAAEDCINEFKETNELYLANPDAVTVELSDDESSYLIIHNDLSGMANADGIFSNTVVSSFVTTTPDTYFADDADYQDYLCIDPTHEWTSEAGFLDPRDADMIDPNGGTSTWWWSGRSSNYYLEILVGELLSNPGTMNLVMPAISMRSEIEEDSFGQNYFTDPADLTTVNIPPSCPLLRGYYTVKDCDDQDVIKGLVSKVENHCPGMILKIDLSGFLPNGDSFNERNLCTDVYS